MNLSPIRWLRSLFLGLTGLLLLGGFALACVFVYLAPGLPTAENAQNVPLRVLTRTGGLISQIGEERRIPVTYEQIPDIVRQAVLAAEDDRFFEHHGFDWMGIARAFVNNLASGDLAGQGGSTITQQAARNMFLTLDQTPRRKASELFVTYRMERELTKEQILATYLNVATFGHRSIGVAAAAETYYGRHLDKLTLSQAATLIGLLPAPSKYNPINSQKLAEARRHYVLGRMVELGFIEPEEMAAAERESVATRGYAPLVDVEADYVAEMVRQDLIERFGPAAVNAGYRVFTTIDDRLQMAANRAVLIGLMEYDRPRGYRGRLGKVKLPAGASASDLDALLEKFDSVGILLPAVVTKVGDRSAQVHVRGGSNANIDWDGLKWARPLNKAGAMGAFPSKAADVVSVGDVIHVVTDKFGSAQLAQVPAAQSAMVAMDPDDGAIVALVGGFDFHRNSFNRIKQAQRQPGSGFKPFLYSAALENGYTAASVFMDSPLVNENCHDEDCWQPENSGGGYTGPMRLREALVRSKNTVSARIIRAIGVPAAIDHAVKFGFRRESLPPYEPLALGVQTVRPLEMVTGYAVFANGGFKVDPYFITRIVDKNGKVVFEATPKIACAECEEKAQPAAPVVAEAGEEAPVAEVPAAPVVTAPADPAAVAAASAPAPHIHDVEAPPALRELALVQGGRGYLPAERLAPRVLSVQNAWIMDDIMHDVTERGTAVRSRSLGRKDLAGKTGTSQNNRDNWFNGFTRQIVATAWVGYDDEKSLGATAEGSSTALPIWIHFMREALRGVPEKRLERPAGLIDLRVSQTTGELADQDDPKAVYETFMVEHPPKAPEGGVAGKRGGEETVF